MANLINQTAVIEEIERQFRLNFKYSPEVEDAFAVCLIILGAIFLLLGTRLFKWCLFLFTMVGVGGITYFIIVVIWHDSTKAFIIGCVVGVVAAIIVFKIWKLSLFLIGVGGGFVVWMVLKALFPTLLTNDIILYATLIVPCIILGIIAVRLEKVWLLLATPLVGSFFLIAGIDHFAHTRLYVFETLKGERNCSDHGGDSCYWMYAAVIGLAIIGFLIQWRITSGIVKGDSKDFSKLDEREAALELQEKKYEERMKRLEQREERRARRPKNKKGMQRLPSSSMSRSELGHDEP